MQIKIKADSASTIVVGLNASNMYIIEVIVVKNTTSIVFTTFFLNNVCRNNSVMAASKSAGTKPCRFLDISSDA